MIHIFKTNICWDMMFQKKKEFQIILKSAFGDFPAESEDMGRALEAVHT